LYSCRVKPEILSAFTGRLYTGTCASCCDCTEPDPLLVSELSFLSMSNEPVVRVKTTTRQGEAFSCRLRSRWSALPARPHHRRYALIAALYRLPE
jgi:hypothetical protein